VVLKLYRDHYYTLEKGQFITSDNILVERWGWSRNKVRSFLHLLEERSYISVIRDKRGTIISISKLDSYGFQPTTEGTTPKQEEESEKIQDTKQINNPNTEVFDGEEVQEKVSNSANNEITTKQEKESEEVQDKEHLEGTANKESTNVRVQEKGGEKYQQLSLYSDIPGSDK